LAGPSNVRAQRIGFKMLSGFVYPQDREVLLALAPSYAKAKKRRSLF
jgi:hypothetical protein